MPGLPLADGQPGRSFHADALRRPRMPVLPVLFPCPQTLGRQPGFACNGTTCRWSRMAGRVRRSALGGMRGRSRRTSRLLAGCRVGLCPRAATARACPKTCATPPSRQPSNSALRASGPTRRFVPNCGSHEQRRDRHAVAAAARSRNRQGDPAAGPIEGDALLSAMDMLAAGDPAATTHIGNACRRRRRHAQVAPVFKATARSAALTTTRSLRILAANDHRCRGDGCPVPVSPGGLASQGECPPISPSGGSPCLFRRQ